jgi:hypothetical protein
MTLFFVVTAAKTPNLTVLDNITLRLPKEKYVLYVTVLF